MSDPQNVSQLVAEFPAIFRQAQVDWAKFKVAVAGKTIPNEKKAQVIEWFYDFPKLWQGIMPHFVWGTPQAPSSDADRKFAEQVNRWIIRLRGEPDMQQQLGVIPIIVIAGVAIAGAFGVAGVAWSLGYVQRQRNISAMIDAVVEGKLPPEVITESIRAEQSQGGFMDMLTGPVKTVLTIGLIIAAVVFLGPQLVAATKKRRG